MCFSAEASFVVGAALLPAGAYCVWSAAVKKPSYLGLALVPVCFGMQQIGEGFVWLGIQSGDADLTRSASLFFLFFAVGFWPFWFPVLAAWMEPEPGRRRVLVGFSVLAISWFYVLFYPLWLDPQRFTVQVAHHSIQYDYPSLAVYDYIPRPFLRMLYLTSVALPLMLSSQKWGRIPGIVLGVSALLSAILYNHAFVSVWCFFAAILASYLCWVFHQLPRPGEELQAVTCGQTPSPQV